MLRVPVVAIMVIVASLLAPAVQAAPPVGTTRISGAVAFFTAVDSGDPCESDHLIVTLAQDAFRSVEETGRPVLEPWFDVQVWHESGCDDPIVSGYTQQGARGFTDYSIEILSCAFVDITFDLYDGESVVRTLDFDLAWTATGQYSHGLEANPTGTKFSTWEVSAELSGTITDSGGLISAADLDYATLIVGNFIIY